MFRAGIWCSLGAKRPWDARQTLIRMGAVGMWPKATLDSRKAALKRSLPFGGLSAWYVPRSLCPLSWLIQVCTRLCKQSSVMWMAGTRLHHTLGAAHQDAQKQYCRIAVSECHLIPPSIRFLGEFYWLLQKEILTTTDGNLRAIFHKKHLATSCSKQPKGNCFPIPKWRLAFPWHVRKGHKN